MMTPANMLDQMILEASQQAMTPQLPPPRPYTMPGMQNFEMGADGLPTPKAQPQESTPTLPPPSQFGKR